MPELGGQRRHRLGIDIGRIGDDEVVAPLAERGEEIALVQRNPLRHPVIGKVQRRKVERRPGSVDRVDISVRKRVGGK